ncbi:hypothetical protein WJX73_002848 [Symbiochloris irregularis]|uniref:Secreted protein n=1 Tax=Symbiochloris irregularis TaxID=706552 RepID=A0AAW1P9Y6_9CHLO
MRIPSLAQPWSLLLFCTLFPPEQRRRAPGLQRFVGVSDAQRERQDVFFYPPSIICFTSCSTRRGFVKD